MTRVSLLILAAGCLSTPARPLDAGQGSADARQFDGPVNGPVLFGDTQVEGATDLHPCGSSQAASFRAAQAGIARSLWVYYGSNAGDNATEVDVALYASDGSGQPTTLLTVGMVTPSTDGQWYRAPISATSIAINAVYWIAVMCPVGKGNQISIRYQYVTDPGGPCNPLVSPCTKHGTATTAFPSTWSTDMSFAPSVNSYYASDP